eukprot:4586411-Amphidinium_carterae.1
MPSTAARYSPMARAGDEVGDAGDKVADEATGPQMSSGGAQMGEGSGGENTTGRVKRECDGQDGSETVVKKMKVDNDILSMWESEDFTSLATCGGIVITPE